MLIRGLHYLVNKKLELSLRSVGDSGECQRFRFGIVCGQILAKHRRRTVGYGHVAIKFVRHSVLLRKIGVLNKEVEYYYSLE